MHWASADSVNAPAPTKQPTNAKRATAARRGRVRNTVIPGFLTLGGNEAALAHGLRYAQGQTGIFAPRRGRPLVLVFVITHKKSSPIYKFPLPTDTFGPVLRTNG